MPLAPRQPERVLFWLVSVAALVSLVALLRTPADTFLWKSLFDAGHAVMSGYLALVFLRLIVAWSGHPRPTWFDYVLAFALTMASGLGIEIVQIFLPRDADLGDLLRNMLGGSAFLLAAWGCERDPGGPFRRSWLLRLVALPSSALLFASAFVPVAHVLASYAQRDAAFPRLCDFEASWERLFIQMWEADLERIPEPEGWGLGGTSAGKAGRVTFHTVSYPRFVIKEPAPDWRGYRDLVFQVYSDLPEPMKVVLRIDDVHHDMVSYTDRFNRELAVNPGANTFRIPLAEVRSAPQGRPMDMTRIARVIVFAVEPVAPFSLTLDAFRLE